MIKQFSNYICKSPNYKFYDEYSVSADIRALVLEGVEINGKPAAVFSYMGVPKLKQGEICPAVVLVHGGGGYAYAEWVRRWNERGYAAISFAAEGDFPLPESAGKAGLNEGESDTLWTKDFSFFSADYHPAPPLDNLSGIDKPINEQWMFNFVSDIFLSRNILCSDSRIDRNRIGLMGVSWGGVASAIAIAYSSFCFAVCVYGSAFLSHGDRIVNSIYKDDNINNIWGVDELYSTVKTPTLWMSSREDINFSPECLELSYERTKANPSFLIFPENFAHSHEAAWSRAEPYDFADFITGQHSVENTTF